MKNWFALLLVSSFVLMLFGCSASGEKTISFTETEPQNEVLQYLTDKYDMEFRLYSATDQDLCVFYIYPDHAERESHILMPENTDDVAEYHKELSWEIAGDELIITGKWQGSFKIDITAETATSIATGKVYTICQMQ